MDELAQILLKDTVWLSHAELELIAMDVSHLNDCFYCSQSHGEITIIYFGDNRQLVENVRKDYKSAAISDILKALLGIVAEVQQGGKFVTPKDIDVVRSHGATDRDIHDTVLIAAAFCLFNRYVDGLDTLVPTDMKLYAQRAKQVAEHGYGPHIYVTKQPV